MHSLAEAYDPVSHRRLTNLAVSRVQVAGPQKGRRGQVRSEEAELAITTSFLRRTLSLVGVRALARLLLGQLEVIGSGAAAAIADTTGIL